MKRTFAFAIGMSMLVAAGTAGTTGQRDLGADVAEIAASTAKLSPADSKVLQQKFLYYTSSNYDALRAPI